MAKGWFNKILPSFVRRDESNEKKSPVPQGLWQSCPNCKEIIYGPDLESNLYVCLNCDHHIRIGADIDLAIYLTRTHMKKFHQS